MAGAGRSFPVAVATRKKVKGFNGRVRPPTNPISLMGKTCYLTGQHRFCGVAPDFAPDPCDINDHATDPTSRGLLSGIQNNEPQV